MQYYAVSVWHYLRYFPLDKKAFKIMTLWRFTMYYLLQNVNHRLELDAFNDEKLSLKYLSALHAKTHLIIFTAK